jgi:hypothetical protein
VYFTRGISFIFLRSAVGRDIFLDVSTVLLTSNDEAVALSVCTMSVVGSILKSAADQIELWEN